MPGPSVRRRTSGSFVQPGLRRTRSRRHRRACGERVPGFAGVHGDKKSVNRFLSMLQFSEADLQQKTGTLSRGQRARVAIAQCLLSSEAVIVLDEPTNHLDITSTQVMERALTHFPGAVIVVSHDRFFVDKLADRLLVFDGGSRAREMLATGAI